MSIRNRAVDSMLSKSPRVDRYGRLLVVNEIGFLEVGPRVLPVRFLARLWAWLGV